MVKGALSDAWKGPESVTQPPLRDFVGYGGRPPDPRWPGGARVALNLVLNYEEGAEYSLMEGDGHAESILSDLAPAPPLEGARFLNIESAYEYGSRVGVWRILSLFAERRVPFTVNAVARALELNPPAAEAFGQAVAEGRADVLAHGWRWIDYHAVPPERERAEIARCVEVIEHLTGAPPLGWYTGRPSPNTRRLVVENGKFIYDSDSYNDDLPYWTKNFGRPHLILPYSLDCNDSRCAHNQGFDRAEDFFVFLRDHLDWLLAEGATTPRMMSVGLHCRLIGRPGRIAGLARFLDHVLDQEGVWLCRRLDIARHWIEQHPPAD